MDEQGIIASVVRKRRGDLLVSSRNRLWHKGEESGNTQQIVDIRLDCDGDVLLLKVRQTGGIACHTGRKSCFYLALNQQTGHWQAVDPIIKDPKELYAK